MKELSKKFLLMNLFSLLFVLIAADVAVNKSGICLSELRTFSKRELVERYFLGENWEKITPQDQEAEIEKMSPFNLGFPECCRINGRSELDYVSFSTSGQDSYANTWLKINNCARPIRNTTQRMGITTKEYERRIESNKKYWGEIDQ